MEKTDSIYAAGTIWPIKYEQTLYYGYRQNKEGRPAAKVIEYYSRIDSDGNITRHSGELGMIHDTIQCTKKNINYSTDTITEIQADTPHYKEPINLVYPIISGMIFLNLLVILLFWKKNKYNK